MVRSVKLERLEDPDGYWIERTSDGCWHVFQGHHKVAVLTDPAMTRADAVNIAKEVAAELPPWKRGRSPRRLGRGA